jgi:hypothetical protein
MDLLFSILRDMGSDATTVEIIIVVIAALLEARIMKIIYKFVPVTAGKMKFLGEPKSKRRTLFKYLMLGLIIGDAAYYYLLVRITLLFLGKLLFRKKKS